MPPSGTASRPLLRASFGSYTITQVQQSWLWLMAFISNSKINNVKWLIFVLPLHLLKVMTEAIPPLTPSLTASLLSKTIVKEMEGDRGERFEVRVLFHMRGDVNRGTCITLHAFKQTEEQKASCITQVLLVKRTIDGSGKHYKTRIIKKPQCYVYKYIYKFFIYFY